MPEKKYSLIKCPHCGYVPNIITDACIKCGSEMNVLCARCGAGNKFGEKKCGKCGAELLLHPENKVSEKQETVKIEREETPKDSGKIKIEIQPIESTIVSDDPEKSARKAAGKPKETAAIPRADSGKREKEFSAGKKPPRFTDTTILATKEKPKGKKLSNAIVVSALSLILFFMLYLIIAPSIPKLKLVFTAKKYLTYLSKGQYEEAYSLLSTNSKATCPLERFVKDTENYYKNRPKWIFKDVKVYRLKENTALIKYMLKEGDGPWRKDILSFVNEHGSWRRPYIWNLFQPIDEAIARKDYSQALFLAQKLSLTDPLDPRSWGYLCTAEYEMQLYDKAAYSCRKTLETEKFYPVGFDEETRNWYYFQLANSLKFTKKYEQAFNIYNSLLADKKAGIFEKCQILINRADAYALTQNYIEALKDIMVAKSLCPGNFQKDIDSFFRYLKGDALSEAIDFARKARISPDSPPIYRLRREQKRKLYAGMPKSRIPKDIWSAQHLGGPEYRVFLKEKKRNRSTGKSKMNYVYVFKVNLWTQSIYLEKGDLNP